MLAVAQVPGDDVGEGRVVQVALVEPVEQRREARDTSCEDEPARPHHPLRLAERPRPVRPLDQVVERAQTTGRPAGGPPPSRK